MRSNLAEQNIYRNLQMYFPFLVRDYAYVYQRGNNELIIRLKNGDFVSYDDVTKSIRNLPPDDRDMTEDECRREFGRRLYKIMANKGITQDELSARTGIHRTIISKYINGRHTPSFFAVDKIAKALGCSIDAFRYCLEDSRY